MKYTTEQQNFIDAEEKRIVLESISGSGKSTSIIGKVNANSDTNTLILTFSKKLEVDLNERLNNFNTKICTLHSLAYNAMNINYGSVSAGGTFDIKKALNISNQEANHLHTMFNMFCCSNNELKDFNSFIINNIKKISAFLGFKNTTDQKEIQKYLDLLQELYESDKFMSHSKYLKMYQLSSANLHDYGSIYVDEYQDLDDCMMDIVLTKTNQKANLYFTGDKNQKIFNWKGTTNFIPEDFVEINLSESMRCPQEILNISGEFIKRKGLTANLKSSIKDYSEVRYETYKDVLEYIKEHKKDYTLISATNTESIEFLMDYIISKIDTYNIKLEFQLNFEKLTNYYKHANNEKTGTWIDGKPFKELIEYFNLIKNETDIFLLISARKLASSNIKLDKLKTTIGTTNKEYTLTFSNVFLTKGREFNNVIIMNDFYKSGTPFLENNYCNYLYTAITRSKYSIVLPEIYKEEPKSKVLDVEFKGSDYLSKIVKLSDLYNLEYRKIMTKVSEDSKSLGYVESDQLHKFVYGMSEKDYNTIERIDRELPSESNMRELNRIICKHNDYFVY